MKQHVTPSEASELTREQFYELFEDLVPRDDWADFHHKKLTIGKLAEVIRKYHQMDIYTVNEAWCVQLFEKDVCANDQEDCIYETDSIELVDALFCSLLWVLNDSLVS